jgi:cysteine-rich repeat protein
MAMPVRMVILVALSGCLGAPTVGPSRCGDGFIDRNEDCDDGVQSATCDMNCTFAECGDTHTNTAAGEQCDDGNALLGDGCSITCRFEGCGDGVVDDSAGEECDDGNRVSGDGCSADCRSWESCGNGVVDAGEACDDGGESFRCNADCTESRCGDFVRNSAAGEACDEGGVDTATCDHDCTAPECRDQVVNAAAGEACDEGGIDTPTCNRDCRRPECGDGLVNVMAGEQCDAAGETPQCDRDCTLQVCGDGLVNESAGEACDEGGVDTATCNMGCTVPACGDGHVNLAAGEDCETGGESLFCDSDCTFVWCGDGTRNVTTGEECDDGNADNSDWCLTSCASASCEDGIRDGDEEAVDCGGSCEACRAIRAMVVAGYEHTCALLETGAVRCWGFGEYGQLGYGRWTHIGDDEAPAAAGDVDVGGPVVQLAAGWIHTCALLETGAVRCWGDGRKGRLG